MEKPVFELYFPMSDRHLKIWDNGKVESDLGNVIVINCLPELLLQNTCKTVENIYSDDRLGKDR